MFTVFNQPFPVEDSFGRHFLRAILIGLFIGLFLIAFQPFGLNDWTTPHKIWKLLGFGGVTFIVTAFNFIVWPRLLPDQFSDKRWTVGREILMVMLNVLLIAVANRFYLEFLISEGKSGISWSGMLIATFLIGIFPVTGAVLFSYIRQLKKYTAAAEELPVHLPQQVISDDTVVSDAPAAVTITLLADNEKDAITFVAADLLFIESSDNYCTVVYLKDGPTGPRQPVKPLLRSSLSRLENQIARAHIVRCHRSYIVNLDRVERVTGNAQGYKLHLLGGQFQVPVARKYNDTLVAELKSL
jgi:hypothetical protein